MTTLPHAPSTVQMLIYTCFVCCIRYIRVWDCHHCSLTYTCYYEIGYSVPRSFEFAVGMAENSLQCIDVTIHDDEFVEDDEELVLKIESLDPNAFVTIVQDYSITTLYIKEDSNDCKQLKCCVIHIEPFSLSNVHMQL